MLDSDWATSRDSRGRLWAVPNRPELEPPKASEPKAGVSILLGLLLGLILAWAIL